MTTRGSLARGQGQQQYQGNVQKWIRQWVEPGNTPGSSKVALLKWIPTGDRSGSKPGPRFPHLQPVSDPNLNLPAGQKDKVKKLIAAQPEPPVQAMPMEIDSDQAASVKRPIMAETAAAVAAGTGAASAGVEEGLIAPQQSGKEISAVLSSQAIPAASSPQAAGASSDQPAAEAVSEAAQILPATESSHAPDSDGPSTVQHTLDAGLDPSATNAPLAPQQAVPSDHQPALVDEQTEPASPPDHEMDLDNAQEADAAAEPMRGSAETDDKPVAQSTAAEEVPRTEAESSQAPDQALRTPGTAEVPSAAQSADAVQPQQLTAEGPLEADAADEGPGSNDMQITAEPAGPEQPSSSKRAAEAQEIDMQPSPKRSKDGVESEEQ